MTTQASYAKILLECADIASQRENTYGDCKNNFEETAAIHNAMWGTDLTAADIVKTLISVKVAREKHQPNTSNRVDAVNYWAILDYLLRS